PRLFQFRQLQMGGVRLRGVAEHLISVKLEKFLRVIQEERMAEDRLRGKIIFLMIKPVLGTKIRNPALGGNSRSSKKHNIVILVNNLLKLCDLILHLNPFLSLTDQETSTESASLPCTTYLVASLPVQVDSVTMRSFMVSSVSSVSISE